LLPELGPAGIQLIGEAIGGIGRQDVVSQIETAVVDDRLFSDQVKMIPRHIQTTRCPESCSRAAADGDLKSTRRASERPSKSQNMVRSD
jgi:hypothetical protein